MKIATWNVNSIKPRLDHLRRWLEAFTPDVVLLQEIKCLEDGFPLMELRESGYRAAVSGQKTYNGVAVLSRHEMQITADRLAGDEADEQARYLEAIIRPDGARPVRCASIYLPNGNPAEDGDSQKYRYKIGWMQRLERRARDVFDTEEAVVLGGDYNVAPDDGDVYAPQSWGDDALCRPETRAHWRRIMNIGYTDALRALSPEVGRYTWWDYRAGAWNKDHGLRIDHLLLSPEAADRLSASGIDRTPRGWEKPSDHTPVWCELRD